MNLNSIYTPKQIEILKACRNTDWFMLINHGAKRSGKTQLDNDIFLQELIRVRGISDRLGIDTPQYILAGYSMGNIQDNILNREFSAEMPDQKWLTDVSEFKYSANGETRKIYLSAILDLYDRRIVAYRIDDRNDNPIVMNTFKEAFSKEPDAHPLCHSDEDSSIRARSSICL